MKKTLIISGALLFLVLVALPFVARHLAPRIVHVPAPSGQPIGKFDVPREEASLLAVRVQIPVQTLADAANREAPRQIQGGERRNIHKSIKNGSYVWSVARGLIRLRNTGQSLAFSAPIDGAARASGDLEIKFFRIPLQGTAEIGGFISGTLNPRVAPNWEIVPNVVPQVKLTKADLHIGQLGAIGISDLLQSAINPVIQEEARKIGPNVIRELDVKGEIQKLWDKANVTDQISKKPPIWIRVQPEEVVATPLDYSLPTDLSAVIAIQSRTSLSNSPPPETFPAPLPNLRIVNQPPRTDLRIPFIVNIDRLNQELSKESFSVKTSIGTKINVTGVQVLVGQNGFLNFSLNIYAQASRWNRPTKGNIWLQGRPIIDYEAQTLAFTDVNFTLETRDTLTTVAAWMLEELLVKSIEKELRIDLNDYKGELDEELQKALQSDDIPEDIEISVKGLDVKLADIYTITKRSLHDKADPGIVIVIEAKGEASTRLKSFK